MAAKGYSSIALVADELGRTLTVAQQTQAAGLIEEAEAYIDRYTGRAWLVASPITDELHALISPLVYLESAPVASVTAVSVRSAALGAAWTALAASGYELLDAARGVLSLGGYPSGDVVVDTTSSDAGTLVRVSYTFTSPSALPADIRRAATLLVAGWMTNRLEPSAASGLVESISVGQGDLAIRYRAGASADSPIPGLVEAILRGHRKLVFA